MQPKAKVDAIQRAVARLEAQERATAEALATSVKTKANRTSAARSLTSMRPQTQLLGRREGATGSLASVGQLPQLQAPLARNQASKSKDGPLHKRTISRDPDTIRHEASKKTNSIEDGTHQKT